MGVKGLWPLLEPVGETCPLSALAGSTVAVDLAGWVVEAETSVALANSVSRPYLRNLVCRSSALLLQHTTPVFVLDGAAPALKSVEMARRQGRDVPHGAGHTQRHQLRARQRRCARLLDALGVPHLWADGEAEALCARLDSAGLVSGVITDDGDAALHGACTLYRQLSATKSGGHVTRYDLRRAEAELGLGVHQLRAMALLLGCDYLPDGLPGVGAATAQQLVQQLGSRQLLTELPRWLSDPPLAEMRAVGELGRVSGHCAACVHPGTETRHRKAGCDVCGCSAGCTSRSEPGHRPCPCQWHRERALADQYVAELKARDCARRAPDFLSQAGAAAAELARVPPLPERPDLSWRRPRLRQFVTAAEEELGWPWDRSRQLVLPLLARWLLLHGNTGDPAPPLQPRALLRTSRHNFVDCYLMRWLVAPSETCPAAEEQLLETHEPRALVEAAHPQLVEQYRESKQKPKKATAGKGKKDDGRTPAITSFFKTRKNADKWAVSGEKQAGHRPDDQPAAEPVVAAAAAESASAPVCGGKASCSTLTKDVRSPGTGGIPGLGTSQDGGASSRARSRHNMSASSEDSEQPTSDGDDVISDLSEDDDVIVDLSAIIDTITRTHISDADVIVISDDEDDVDLPGGRDVVFETPAEKECKLSQLGAVVSSESRRGGGPNEANEALVGPGATDADPGADSESDEADGEYVPLARRLQLRC